MKASLILSFLFLSLSYGHAGKGIIIPYSLDKSTKDSLLGKNEAIFTFTFKGFVEGDLVQNVHYSIDNIEKIVPLSKDNSVEIRTTPGVHNFQFFLSEDYAEVYITELEINSQHRDEYSVHLVSQLVPIVTFKPVIYLYPEEETDVEVKINIRGMEPFFYPAYDDGWKITARPDGTITHNGGTYNYLFWESTNFNRMPANDVKTGFVAKGDETISFLEEKLALAGLTSKEQADFITFWGPKLIQNKANFVRFEFNDACNKFAELEITPKPDNIYRIYILWSPVDPNYEVIEQEIVPMTRKGFTVIEWGGQEHNIGEIVEKNKEL